MVKYRLRMNAPIKFIRRIGPAPSGAQCFNSSACPDIWELENGDFAIIGVDITTDAMEKLPPTAGCAAHERIIRLPRNLLVNAKRDIPDKV